MWKLNKDYAIDLNLCYSNRQFSDGITFFELVCNYDKYLADHKPSFDFSLTILNFVIFEFDLYYIHHRDETENYG